ncbi:MAG TPA: YfiR family protein [Usitatibacteraceae bacterium]
MNLRHALARLLITAGAAALCGGQVRAVETPPPLVAVNEAAPPTLPADSKPLISGMVEGIISYTKWPADLKQVRLCIIGDGAGAKELLKSGPLGSAQRSIDVQRIASTTDNNPDCQVLYFAARYTAKQRAMLNRFVARPFLTIGEGPEFCSDGGMFCVDSEESTSRFGVNLDAIARSGLRVNPQVLSLGRAKPKVQP